MRLGDIIRYSGTSEIGLEFRGNDTKNKEKENLT